MIEPVHLVGRAIIHQQMSSARAVQPLLLSLPNRPAWTSCPHQCCQERKQAFSLVWWPGGRRDLRKLTTFRQGIPSIPADSQEAPQEFGAPQSAAALGFKRMQSKLGRSPSAVQRSAPSAPQLHQVRAAPPISSSGSYLTAGLRLYQVQRESHACICLPCSNRY